MKFLILALSVVSLRADTDATCLAGTDTGNTAETDENCTARVAVTNDEATCQSDGNALVCQWAMAVCDAAAVCTTNTATNGVCAVANVTNGDGCDDGDAGTENDVCTDGTCAGTAPAPTYGTDATCLAGSDTGNTAETDANCTARGITAALCDTEGTGLVCAHTPATCTDTADDCTESVAVDGVCGAPASVTDGTDCDDGDDATETDVCTGGVCAGTPTPAPVVAHSGDATCTAGSGATLTDQECTDNRGIADAATCDAESDGSVCVYQAAACADDGNACTTNTATAGVCATANVDDATSCDDGDDTTEEDVCTAGVCAGTAITEAPVPAPTSSDATCLAGTGATLTDAECTARTIVDAATCDVETDGTVCAYTAANCVDDGNDCTTASTATDGVCSTVENVEDGTSCDDGDEATSGDVCTSGACAGVVDDSPATSPSDGTDAATDAASSEEIISPATHAQVFAALASAFLLL